MDRGGWCRAMELARTLRISLDNLMTLCWHMSWDPKDRVQVSVVYRNVSAITTQPHWELIGVGCLRAVQGHSLKCVDHERTASRIPAEVIKNLACLCHGTTWKGFAGMLTGFQRPGGGTLRAAAEGVAEEELRNETMMSPFAYFDKDNYVSGARHDSPLYLFYDLDIMSGFDLFLTPRGSVVTRDDVPWVGVEVGVAKGWSDVGADDVMVFHAFARQWGRPVGVTEESKARYKKFLRKGGKLDPAFCVPKEQWDDVKLGYNLDKYFECPACDNDTRMGCLFCYACWCEFVWEMPWWALAMVMPHKRKPTDEEIAATKGTRTTAFGILQAYYAIETAAEDAWKAQQVQAKAMPMKAVASAAPAAASSSGSGGPTLSGATGSGGSSVGPTLSGASGPVTLEQATAESLGTIKADAAAAGAPIELLAESAKEPKHIRMKGMVHKINIKDPLGPVWKRMIEVRKRRERWGDAEFCLKFATKEGSAFIQRYSLGVKWIPKH